MLIKSAEYISSSVDIKNCPSSHLPEYAFWGRSNVGKSSLINMLTDKKKLAKVAVKPGKTKTINHFIINNEWYIADLPGYGFAKISKSESSKWQFFVKDYLNERINLQCTFLLIDSRLSPQKNDIYCLEWLGKMEIPVAIVFTKADKQSQQNTNHNIELFKSELLKSWESLPPMFVSSSKTKLARKEILNFISDVNKRYPENSHKLMVDR